MRRLNDPSPRATDYERVECAIRYLETNYNQQPDLKTLARNAGLSEFHFQRLFRRWAGISPKRFLQALTAGHTVRLLRAGHTNLDAAHAAGLSGGGRLHDLIVNLHAVTPGAHKQLGAGLNIQYGFHPTPFGECLIAVTERGICHLGFVPQAGHKAALAELTAEWPQARVQKSPSATAPIARRLFAPANGGGTKLDLCVRGTNFQIKVWEALLRIPEGEVVSYEVLARHIGAPRGVRAVANAVARNPVAYLIPCHRVIRKTGALGGYRWGETRKQVLLAWEAARTETPASADQSPGQCR